MRLVTARPRHARSCTAARRTCFSAGDFLSCENIPARGRPRVSPGYLVRAAGLEPARAAAPGSLSPMRLPFRHARGDWLWLRLRCPGFKTRTPQGRMKTKGSGMTSGTLRPPRAPVTPVHHTRCEICSGRSGRNCFMPARASCRNRGIAGILSFAPCLARPLVPQAGRAISERYHPPESAMPRSHLCPALPMPAPGHG